uniref:Uncharacterized protein n=1 Tax=Moniliophthora roreri TaxID=221103 RepID=A0A0W0FIX6_MONRR
MRNTPNRLPSPLIPLQSLFAQKPVINVLGEMNAIQNFVLDLLHSDQKHSVPTP